MKICTADKNFTRTPVALLIKIYKIYEIPLHHIQCNAYVGPNFVGAVSPAENDRWIYGLLNISRGYGKKKFIKYISWPPKASW